MPLDCLQLQELHQAPVEEQRLLKGENSTTKFRLEAKPTGITRSCYAIARIGDGNGDASLWFTQRIAHKLLRELKMRIPLSGTPVIRPATGHRVLCCDSRGA